MGLCKGGFDKSGFVQKLKEVYDTISDLAEFSTNDNTEVIEQLARAKLLYEQMGDLKDQILGSALSSILCEIIENAGIEEKFEEIEGYTKQLDELIDDLDDSVSFQDASSFDNFEQVESLVNNFFIPFESEKEKIFDIIKYKTKDVFSILVSIGASQTEINEAVEEVILTANIKEYLLGVFDSILNSVLLRLDD